MRHPSPSSLLVLSLLLTPAVEAKQRPPTRAGDWCGTGASALEVAMARHLEFERRLERETPPFERATRSGPKISQAGKIVIIEDDGTLVSDRNTFDLERRSIEFTRQGDRFVARRTGGGFNNDLGSPLPLRDDDIAPVDLPFTFSFYGRQYDRMFVNSDGNITFEQGDGLPTNRDLSRFLEGSPRIAPFFDDLDPGAAAAGGGVFLAASAARVRVTWLDVPEFQAGNRNTFQVTLFPDGRILMAWRTLESGDAVVGVSPGNAAPVELVDMSDELPVGPTAAAIAERFSDRRLLDDLAVGKAFYERFRDAYHFLVVWLDFSARLDQGFAFELNIKNKTRGIGLQTFDLTSTIGSRRRLEAYVQMGSLDRYPANPAARFAGTYSTLDILGHETGHRWLAFVQHRGAGGGPSNGLLGRRLSHWSFHHDTDASFVEGNDVRDNGGGMFTTVAASSRYSPLDRYLMGFIPASQVPDFFYVDNTSGPSATAGPRVGVTIRGRRVNVSVDDVIAVEGPRSPTSAKARKKFRMAFVLLALPGQPPSQASIDKLERIRREWIPFFQEATGGRGKISMPIRLK